MLPKQYGGLAVPDICKYYQTVYLSRLIDWNRHCNIKLWVQLEQAQSAIPLCRASWCYNSLPRDMKSHPLIGRTVRIYSSLLAQTPLSSPTSPVFAILGNPLFTLGYQVTTFRNLMNYGRSQASHFLIDGCWPSIPDLINPTGPFCLEFWRALQLTQLTSSDLSLPRATLVDLLQL